MNSKKDEVLFSRLEDLKRCAIRGNLGVSAFFTPREAFAAEEYLKRSGAPHLFFGGYEYAERVRCYLLPEFIDSVEKATEICEYGYSLGIDSLFIKGSGFESISHRAIMGSVLSLGIERDAIGDIVILDDHNAIFFCDSKISDFLITNIDRIGRDKVSVKRIAVADMELPQRQFLQISDTVASARLDCIVSALCSLSRERAKERIEDMLVELNYEIESRPDKEVVTPAILSVRGVGKFKILSVSDKTKKGRYRLIAEKYL